MMDRFGLGVSASLFTTSEGGEPFTLAELEEINRDAPIRPEDRAGIEALQAGQSITVGGGASGETTVTRVR
jgi:hypothetical protein